MKRDGKAGGLDPAEFEQCEKPECHWNSYVRDLLYEARRHNPLLGEWHGDIKEAKTVTI